MKAKYEVWIDESDRTIYLENAKGMYCPFSWRHVDTYSCWLENRYEELARGDFGGNETPPQEGFLFGYITPEGLVYWRDYEGC